ncbi:MAG TPA: Zn-ribbon domain-containing OB-fold protein [Symbiobacteriaceae bacterium]|nr:Zn-ribbon domain-containing OB-fold protein [Symbiobacteriaceae bacterium]
MSEYAKPLPVVDPDSRPYWDAARAHRLMIQRCTACGKHQFYPRSRCSQCFADVEWVEASGRGHVYSFTIIHRAPGDAFQQEAPYVVALVDLAEGVRMMTNLRGIAPEEVRIGMPVRVTFADVTPEVTLPQFEPA